ncbi:MAG: energy-coupling factor ABC transporter ATP-binding protein [Rubrobacteraceae bacterium]
MRLELEEISYVYSRGTPFEIAALRGVSLAVEAGEVLGVCGGTGSGKSTLAQHTNLLLSPTSGRVLVDGVDAASLEKIRLRQRVGLVFQFPEQALFAPTVEEDVAFAPRQLGLDEEEVRTRVEEVLVALGASRLARRSPHNLSGGEKRRVAVAGVLAMNPEVLVLDEPTAGLDPATRETLLDLIRSLRGAGISVVLISHDLDEVAEVADRVCILEQGEVKAVGTPAEVFYGHPEYAPTMVRVVSSLIENYPEIVQPVRYVETVNVLKKLLER